MDAANAGTAADSLDTARRTVPEGDDEPDCGLARFISGLASTTSTPCGSIAVAVAAVVGAAVAATMTEPVPVAAVTAVSEFLLRYRLPCAGGHRHTGTHTHVHTYTRTQRHRVSPPSTHVAPTHFLRAIQRPGHTSRTWSRARERLLRYRCCGTWQESVRCARTPTTRWHDTTSTTHHQHTRTHADTSIPHSTITRFAVSVRPQTRARAPTEISGR